MPSSRRNGSRNTTRNTTRYTNRNITRNRLTTYDQMRIFCHICSQVVCGTPALLTHLEAHINQRRLEAYLDQPLSLANNRFLFSNQNASARFAPTPSVLPLRIDSPPNWESNFSLTLGRGGGNHSHSPIGRPQVSPITDDVNRNGNMLERSAWQREEDVVSPIDGTRPFLSLLDRPIPVVIDLEMENEDGLDLSLRL